MKRYAIALSAVILTTGLGFAVQTIVRTNAIAFSLFVPPILIAGLMGGLGPSVLATVVGGFSAEFLFRRPYLENPNQLNEIVAFGLYLLIGIGISALANRLARAQHDVQRREKDFETLFRVTPIGIGIASDPECRHISVNPAFAELLRLPTGGNASLSAPSDERPPFRVTKDGEPVAAEDLPLQRAARLGKDVRHVELDVEHPDGTRVSLYEYATPLFDDEGNVRGAIGAFLDITERRKTEEALRQALAENATLYKQAQEASQLKDEFLAILSHELRTPLNALLGWIQLLKSGRLSEEKHARALDAIERSAELQARLTADLLDVSAAMTGKLSLDRKTIDPAPILAGVVDSLRPAADDKRVALFLNLDPWLPVMPLDAARVQQVVWNLISNAIKFTPDGGSIYVKAERDGTDVVISVADTGLGIPATFLPFVFDRFRQADAGTTREHTGLGLGLAIVKHIVDLHGGEVTVESGGEGRGARFTVRLPAGLSAVAPAKAETPTADPTPPPAPDPVAAPGPPSR